MTLDGSHLIDRDKLRGAAWDSLKRLARFVGVPCFGLDTWATRRVLADRILAAVNRSRAEHRRAMAAQAFAGTVEER